MELGAKQSMVRIYRLRDPRDGAVRYVGKTVQPLKDRLHVHVASAKHYRRRRVCNWISSLKRLGLVPLIDLIEYADEANWQEREKHWIAYHRATGDKLTNLTDGGEGFHGLRHSEETKAKIGASNRGKVISREQREKQRLAMLGRSPSPEARAKLSAAGKGRVLTEAHRASISANRAGKGSMPGAANPRAKLTAADVLAIRASTEQHAELGRRYGVNEVTIHGIRSRRIWKCVA